MSALNRKLQGEAVTGYSVLWLTSDYLFQLSIVIIGMIYVPLQDLHLVHSMDWISELSRRYHSVRMHILTPYGEVFPTRPVGNESTL